MSKTCQWFVCLAVLCTSVSARASSEPQNLVKNPDFRQHDAAGRQPVDYELTGNASYSYLGDPKRDASGWGVALHSGMPANGNQNSSGSVSQTITGIDANTGRWFRFSFRGLPQDNFAVAGNDLYMKVEYFGDGGKQSFDGKVKKIYSQVEQDRRDLSVNGDRRVGGAAVWRMYQFDFWLPFPQVTQLQLSVGFDHGAAKRAIAADFLITDFSLMRIEGVDPTKAKSAIMTVQPAHKMVPLGGRWYYQADPDDTQSPPRSFDYTNADRLIYHDANWTAPFAGNMTSWLRAGDKDLQGNIVPADEFISDNVTIRFDEKSMIIHTRGLPNHPTGKFPEAGFGNPNYIQELDNTYYVPLDPQVNARHITTTTNNSNHALPMGPIGIAMNGVVFFNPFDMGNQDASNMMDRCCGHPNQDGMYHYHKYPICVNSPWADEGKDHSPLIGWAFDGFPIYGPYEKAGVLAKDVSGESALNAFNLHWDKDRGWHYHVTPGKFPYIIGGYWGTEDSRDSQRPRGRRPGGPGGGPNGPPEGFGPPPG